VHYVAEGHEGRDGEENTAGLLIEVEAGLAIHVQDEHADDCGSFAKFALSCASVGPVIASGLGSGIGSSLGGFGVRVGIGGL
jgi:hypothetical protein